MRLVGLRPGRGPKDVNQCAVFADVTIHEISDFPIDLYRCLRLFSFWLIVGMNELDIMTPHQLVRRVTPQLVASGVDREKAAFLVDRADHVL